MKKFFRRLSKKILDLRDKLDKTIRLIEHHIEEIDEVLNYND